MPYIKPVDRVPFNVEIQQLAAKTETTGQVAYVVFAYVRSVIQYWGATFDDYAAILGAADAALGEIKRRDLAPYEAQKALENGDVSL